MTLSVAIIAQLGAYAEGTRFLGVADALTLSMNVAFVTTGLLTMNWLRSSLPPIRYWGVEFLAPLIATVWAINAIAASTPGVLRLLVALAVSTIIAALFFRFVRSPFVVDCRSFLLPRRELRPA